MKYADRITVFACFCWAYFPVVFCLYPETSRRTLEDMDQIFIQYPGLLVFGKSDLTQRERPQAFITAAENLVNETKNTKLGQTIVDDKAATVITHNEKV
jgi:hypothetical protein